MGGVELETQLSRLGPERPERHGVGCPELACGLVARSLGFQDGSSFDRRSLDERRGLVCGRIEPDDGHRGDWLEKLVVEDAKQGLRDLRMFVLDLRPDPRESSAKPSRSRSTCGSIPVW